MTPKQLDLAIGIDLGGTNIKAVLVTEEGQTISQRQITTPASRSIREVADAIISLILDFSAKDDRIKGVGLGSPGLVDEQRKIIRFSPNFPGWKNVPLWQLVTDRISLPLILENDVNCFALGEHRWGAGKDYRHLFALAVGTGVGGALILDNSLYRGSSGAAGELGHVSIDLQGPDCACGNKGCIERYLGVRWFVEAARLELGNDMIITPADVGRLAQIGNTDAIRFLEGRGELLGVVCTSLIHALDPEVIIIGGGIANAGEPFFRGIRRAIKEHAYPPLADMIQVLAAKLGDAAGSIGAASLGFEAGSLP